MIDHSADSPATTDGAVPQAAFRSVMSGFVTGVCVATTRAGDGAPSGLTVNSFTSVSLEPPLVSVCIDLRSRTLTDFRDCGSFAINILASDQRDLARACAVRTMDWDALALTVWETGAPVLTGALSALDCRIEAEHPAGDHAILIGRVLRAGWLRRDAAPLTYHRSRYGGAPPALGG